MRPRVLFNNIHPRNGCDAFSFRHIVVYGLRYRPVNPSRLSRRSSMSRSTLRAAHQCANIANITKVSSFQTCAATRICCLLTKQTCALFNEILYIWTAPHQPPSAPLQHPSCDVARSVFCVSRFKVYVLSHGHALMLKCCQLCMSVCDVLWSRASRQVYFDAPQRPPREQNIYLHRPIENTTAITAPSTPKHVSRMRPRCRRQYDTATPQPVHHQTIRHYNRNRVFSAVQDREHVPRIQFTTHTHRH